MVAGLLAGVAWAVGCGDGTTAPPQLPPPLLPATVIVTPGTAEFTALGETVQLTVEVRDQHGQVMAGVTVAWVSTSTGVATVDAAGLVTAAGNGTSTITATAGAASGSAAVIVAQVVKGIEVLPARGKVSAGDTLRMTAEAWDAHGFTVPASEFTWSSSDTAVATVDGSGLVHGIVEGVVTVTATSAGVPGAVPVTVAHPDWGPLAALYEAAQGPVWIEDDGWMSDRPIGEWHGVTTRPDGHVIALELASSHLTGTIPADLGRLSHLETLNLQWNRLRGPIPLELTRLHSLRSLWLGVNALSGEIPAELANLTNLEDLRLNHGYLTGRIPPEPMHVDLNDDMAFSYTSTIEPCITCNTKK